MADQWHSDYNQYVADLNESYGSTVCHEQLKLLKLDDADHKEKSMIRTKRAEAKLETAVDIDMRVLNPLRY